MNSRAYVVSIEYDHEGETILGVFGSEGYAKSRAMALDTERRTSPPFGTGDAQHVRLFCGSECEVHLKRKAKYREVPEPKYARAKLVRDGWTDWAVVA